MLRCCDKCIFHPYGEIYIVEVGSGRIYSLQLIWGPVRGLAHIPFCATLSTDPIPGNAVDAGPAFRCPLRHPSHRPLLHPSPPDLIPYCPRMVTVVHDPPPLHDTPRSDVTGSATCHGSLTQCTARPPASCLPASCIAGLWAPRRATRIPLVGAGAGAGAGAGERALSGRGALASRCFGQRWAGETQGSWWGTTLGERS